MSSSYCVLFSGGIESCVLVGILAESAEVFPLRVHYGLRWEEEEQAACERFLDALTSQRRHFLQLLTVVTASAAASQRPGWSVDGPVPSAASPDTAVELPDRNTTLFDCAAQFCAPRSIHCIAIGTLAGNPFPDATCAFFRKQEFLLSQQYGIPLSIVAPFRHLTKAAVLRDGVRRQLPLEHSLSCLNSLKGGIHCGDCNKCAERRRAFQEAGITDPTPYATSETACLPT